MPLPEHVTPLPEDQDDLHGDNDTAQPAADKWQDLGLAHLQ